MALTAIPFVHLDDPRYARVVPVTELVQRVVAENPSKYTYRGTGTYIVGGADVAVIDPGPLLDSHRRALGAALAGRRVQAIVVTHCHSDHSPLSEWLAAETGAPTVAIGPHATAEPEDAADDEGDADVPREEAIDASFDPQRRVIDGEVAAAGPGWTLRAVHTPGHTSNHLCVALDEQGALFTGDHVMGWSTTVVSPPDGDMAAYIASLRKVQGRADAMLLPTHGAPVHQPGPFLDALVRHRLEREAQILASVRSGATGVAGIVAALYADVSPDLHKAAARSVLAHLVKLVDEGLVASDRRPSTAAAFHAV